MGQDQLFAVPVEADLVLPGDGSAAHGMDAHLAGLPLGSAAIAAENRLPQGLRGLLDGIVKHQRGAAGTVRLHPVVTFDDLHIEIFPEGSGGFLHQMAQDVDAQAHVCTAENGNFPASFFDHLKLRFVITGRAQHGRHFFFPGQLQKLRQRRRAGKVNQHIGLLPGLIEGADNGVIRRLARIGHVHAADDLHLRFGGCSRDLPTHAAQCAAKKNFHKASSSFLCNLRLWKEGAEHRSVPVF